MKLYTIAILLALPTPAFAQWHGPSCTPSRQAIFLTPVQYQRFVQAEYLRQLSVYAAKAPTYNLERELANADARVRRAASVELQRRAWVEKSRKKS